MVEKWQFVENVVRAIESVANANLPEVEVIPKAMVPMKSDPSIRREVDVLVRFRAGSRRIAIGVEAKDESRPLDITVVEQTYEKYRKLELDRIALVSSSGFVETARKVYQKERMELLTLSEVDDLAWAGLTSMHTRRRVAHFDTVQVTYNRPRDEIGIDKLPINEVEVVEGSSRVKLPKYLAVTIGNAIPNPLHTEPASDPREYVPPGPTPFNVHIEFEDHVRASNRLRASGKLYPFPDSIQVVGEFRVEVLEHSTTMYRDEKGFEVVSCIVAGPNDEPYQVSIIQNPEGGSGVQMVVGPAEPSRTKA